jgi:hypothetical protein
MRNIAITGCLLGILLSGCAVTELRRDQDQIRSALLDLYTNQIMDNLIRARNGYPIIHLDYTNATGTVTVKGSGNIGANQAVTNSNVLALPANTLSRTRTIVTTLMGGISGENTNQVAVTATPVLTANDVYDAYLMFLAIPGSLVVTDEPPPACAAHIVRQCGCEYYWVPSEFKGDFLNLSLVTTAQRGKSLASPDQFFSVQLIDVAKIEDNEGDPESKIVTLVFDKKIPNDSGTLTFDEPLDPKGPVAAKAGSVITRYPFDRYLETKPGQDDFEPSLTNKLDIGVLNSELPGLTKLPRGVKVYQHHNRPTPPTTEDLLERANFQLQQIQMNQLRSP